jgi:hypothetical protein
MAGEKSIEIVITAKNLSDAELAKARASIAGFKKDTEGASGATSGFGGALRNASSLAGAFGVTLGVGAVVKFGKALLDDADALVKLSDKTGMSVDAVQRLKYIAEQSGNTLEQLTSAVSMLQRRLANGDDSAIAALRGLGIEVERFQQLTPDEQFMAIAREVAKIEDPMQRVKVATDLLGRSGAEVLPSLLAKVDELADKAPVMSAKAVAAFDAIGDSLSDMWARTKNAIGEGLATMFDSYGRLASGMKALFSGDVSNALAIFTDLAQTELPKVANAANIVNPPLKAIALNTKEVEAIEAQLDATRKHKIETDKAYATQQEKIAAALEKVGMTTRAAVTEELALYQAILKKPPTIAGVNTLQIVYLQQLEDLAARAKRASLVIPELTAAVDDARLVAEHAGDGFTEWELSLPIAPIEELIGETNTQSEALDTQAIKARLLTDAYHDFGLKTPEELRKVADQAVGNYRRIVEAVGANAPAAVAAYKQMIDAQIAVSGELPKSWATSVVPGIKSALGTLQTAVSGSFAQMMLGAKGFHDGFVDIWFSLKATALRIFAEIADSFVSGLMKRMLAALAGNRQAFAGGFASLFTGVGGGSASGGTWVGGAGGLAGFWGNQVGGLPGSAGSVIGPEFGTGDILKTGAGAGTNWGAMAGGGMMAAGGTAGYLQARKSGSKLGQTLSGAMTGAGVGTMFMPGIGTAIGAGVGAIAGFASSLFGGNKEYKEVKAQRAEFEAQFGGAPGLIKAVSDAYVKLGRTGTEAEAALKNLWQAKDATSYEAAVTQINTALAKSNELAGLQQQLADRQAMNLQTAEELTAKYGGTLGNLGQQFVAAKQQASFKEIWDEWQTLIDMGADVGGTLVMMKEEIGALAGESRRIGTEIPAQFKPLIEELIRTGQLFDDTGEQITDISTLTFGAPLVSATDELIAKINELVDALKNGLTPAINGIPTRVSVKVGYEIEDFPEFPGREVSVEGHAAGALITRPHLAMVGEGGEPELIGPVGFMRDALAGAMASLGGPQASSDRLLAELVRVLTTRAAQAQATVEPYQVTNTFNIKALDPVGLKQVVETDVIPLLVSAYRRNVNGARTQTRKELVE